MSLSPNDNGSYSRVSSATGKTPPPPAPSAAFAKRARELQQAESLGARYRPPALRTLASGGSPPSENHLPSITTPGDTSTLTTPTNISPGFRRPRAGTLPSNVQLAASRMVASPSTAFTSADLLVDLTQRQQTPLTTTTLAPQPTNASITRPVLRHSTTTVVQPPAPAPALTETTSRLRSGSLTLPSAGLANPFGSSIFSSSWLPPNSNSGTGFSVLDELRSVVSADSGVDDFGMPTLDYLELDESQRPPPAATMSELRNQAQAAIAGNLANPSRMRATTVSNPYRNRTVGVGSLLPTHVGDEEEDYFVDNYETLGYGQHLSPYESPNIPSDLGQSSYLSKLRSTDQFARPRAISVGMLDDPLRSLHGRTPTGETHSYMNELPSNVSLANNLHSGLLKTDNKMSTTVRPSVSPNVHYSSSNKTNPDLPIGRGAAAYLLAPNNQNRSLSPKSESTTQVQTPTRSLWIGNLDSSVTSEQLIHVFAPYGAIESLRLLPEKECGFVNFVDQVDAIRAKDDVLNRLGGNIGMSNGQTVRIGFGKADSAPVAPAKGSSGTNGSTSPSSVPKTPGAASTSGGIDAQLQSTPTRALWIGSIPSTTTPATILSVFSPYGPIESARVLTHKNCGFINFERLDDAVRARKALNGRDVLGSDVGAIRIGYAKVPVKNSMENGSSSDDNSTLAQGIGDMSVGATIHALRGIKGASTIPAEQQVLGGAVENYRSNLLLSMIASGMHTGQSFDGKSSSGSLSVTEQQMILRELSGGSAEAELDIQTLADFRPPTMYYTTIPLVSERPHNKRWDASKLRELRKRLDSGSMTTEEIDQVAADFMDGEIVDLASDWLGNTVVQKLFERCSAAPKFAMLERIAPHLAMIGIHKNGTWAAQKIIECVANPEEIALISQNLRAYTPPLLLDQFGNYVVQCCLRFGAPANEFIFDAIADRMWEVAQGRFGARSMRACLESPHITVNQQRRIATAIILNSIPLATNPNGALLLTWLLDTSGFPSRYNLLAPRFTPHLSHLCTHKLASLTVLRIVNQKIEPEASCQIVDSLFNSPGDHVLTDVLGDQVNGVAVVHKILTSPFIDPHGKAAYIEATKRVIIELKVIATQAYRRLIEEVGLPVPNFQPTYNNTMPPTTGKVTKHSQNYGVPGLPSGYPSNDQSFASMMAALQMGGQNPQTGPPVPQLQVDSYNHNGAPRRSVLPSAAGAYSPATDPFNPFARTPEDGSPRQVSMRRMPGQPTGHTLSAPPNPVYGGQSPILQHGLPLPGMNPQQSPYAGMTTASVPPHLYQPYMYQPYQQGPNMGAFHA